MLSYTYMSNFIKGVNTMNSRQLQYAIVLSESLSISKAAEKLKITQPALSKQILSLEEEMGVVLFNRGTTPLSLTPAGEHFIREAKELLFRETELKHSMEDFKSGDKGRLVIGVSPFKAAYFLSSVIKELHNTYTGLQVVLRETNSSQLHKDAVDGLVDFAIVNLPVDTGLLDVIPLEAEPLVLAVHKKFCSNILIKQNAKKQKIINLNDCKEFPFIALGKTQELRQMFDKMCIINGFSPRITTEVVGITTAWNMAQAGVGATIVPYQFLGDKSIGEDMEIFLIENFSTMRQPAIVMRKNKKISKYANLAIELIKNR